MNKNIIRGIVVCVVLILVIGGAFFASRKNNNPYENQPLPQEQMVSTSTSATSTTAASESTTTQSYTLAEVKTHTTKENCWTVINGNVYDVTSWISQHPGGQKAILSLCGIDGTSKFEGQHAGQARPETELASFKIGVLAN